MLEKIYLLAITGMRWFDSKKKIAIEKCGIRNTLLDRADQKHILEWFEHVERTGLREE